MNAIGESWNDFKRRYPIGAIVSETIVVKRPYGVFVDFVGGAEGRLLITRIPPNVRPRCVVHHCVGARFARIDPFRSTHVLIFSD